MQTVIDTTKLKPYGYNILIKQAPMDERVKSILIPDEYRDRNDLHGQLFCGIVIACGEKTKAFKFGISRGWFEPGDTVWFWNMYDWKDHEMVIKDEKTGEQYLVIKESDVKAYEFKAVETKGDE